MKVKFNKIAPKRYRSCLHGFKAVFIFGKALLLLMAILICAEGLVRFKLWHLQSRFIAGDTALTEGDYSFLWLPIVSKVNHRLWKYFLLGKNDPRLRTLPQQIPYGDKDEPTWDNVRRFRLKHGAYHLQDFTRDPLSSGSVFLAQIDSAGFRGPERSLAKKLKTVRILCWGAYQTFGHGVDDDSTYPAQLEKVLNSGRNGRFEVWNAGVQSMSLHDSMSRIRPDVEDVKPGIAIIEFGFVDIASIKVDYLLNPLGFLFRKGTMPWRVGHQMFAHLYTSFLGKSYLLALLFQKITSERSGEALAAWRNDMKDTISFLRKRGIAIVLMNPTVGGFPLEEYKALVPNDPGVVFFNSGKAFADYLKANPQVSQQAQRPVWMEEFDEPTQRLLTASSDSVLKKNFTHPNELGYRVIAEKLSPVILNLSRKSRDK